MESGEEGAEKTSDEDEGEIADDKPSKPADDEVEQSSPSFDTVFITTVMVIFGISEMLPEQKREVDQPTSNLQLIE